MILNTRDNNKKVYVSESQLASLGNASDDGRAIMVYSSYYDDDQ